MARFNSYDALERLSVLSSRAVFIACSATLPAHKGELAALKITADKAICELERSLFSDFMPPLERSDIAACAHALSQVIGSAYELSAARGRESLLLERKNKEAEICIRLSQMIEECVSSLRRLKRPEQLPDLVRFRKLLCDARVWHASVQKKLSAGIYPRSAQSYLSLLRTLCNSLDSCFDTLIEIMLSNI
jgi:hypothetical protein